MKNSLEEFKVIFEQAEGRVSKLENRKMGIIKSEEQKKINKVQEKWTEPKGPVRHHHVERLTHCGSTTRRRVKRKQRLFEEIKARNLQNLVKDRRWTSKVDEIQVAWIERGSHWYIHFKKQSKVKDKENLKCNKRKANGNTQSVLNKIISSFIIRKFGGRKAMRVYFQVLKKRIYQPRILYPAKLSLKCEGEIKTFPKPELFLCHETCLARNPKGSPACWNKKILDDSLKLYEEIEILVKVSIWIFIKVSITVTTVCKEIQPVHPKGNQSWVFTGGTDVEAEIPIFWPPDAKSWLIWKDLDVGKDWRQEEKGTTEYEIVRWNHWLNGHEFG